MIKFKNLLFLLPLLTVSLTSIAMEETTAQVSAATTRAIFSHEENIFKDLQNDIGEAKFISFDALVFTNQDLRDAIKQAKENGAHVEGTLGTHHSNKDMQNFFNNNDIDVHRTEQNHLKLFLMSEKDPELGSPGKHVVIVGSANPTNYAYRNAELSIRTENDKTFFMENHKIHKNSMLNNKASTLSEKNVLENTPKKENTAISSCDTMLIASKALRVQNLINSKNKQRILDISSMSWNSPEMTSTLIAAQQNGITIRIILDRSALTGRGKEQLAQMHNAGVPIYIYNPGENNRTIQHSKVMLRIDGSEYLAINSTANMTPEGDKENNTDSYHSKSEDMVKKIQLSLDKLITSDTCTPYNEAIVTLAEREKSKQSETTKKRLNQKTDNDTNKKKKLDKKEIKK